MDLSRDVKRKVMKEILELAQGGAVDELKAKKPKPKVEPSPEKPAGKEECADCAEGECEEHDSEGYKSKLTSMLEQMTAGED